MYTTSSLHVHWSGWHCDNWRKKEIIFFNLWKLQAHVSRLLLLKSHKFEFVSYFKDDNWSCLTSHTL